jgi:hypothetical protein
VSPAPRAKLGRAREAGDVTELGDEQAGEDPPETMDGLDGFVAGMAARSARWVSRSKVSISRSRRTRDDTGGLR